MTMENVAKRLHTQPQEVLARLRFIGNVAQELGYPVYVVGGFVRDLLLGVEDYDLDIVVEGDGIHFAKELSSRLHVGFVKHKQFGTATLITHDKVKVDVATARQETYEYPASLPKVKPGSIKDDLARRDFTINALALDISRNNFGALVDFFHGRKDLNKKAIRALYDISFIDDPTRILRAIRFEQRFGFTIERHTFTLLKDALKKHMLEAVHKHRLRDEFILILKESQAFKCIKRINGLCGFAFIEKKLRLKKKALNTLKKIEGTYTWFRDNYPHKHKVEVWLLYLMVLLEHLDSMRLKKVFKEFAFRRSEMDAASIFKEESSAMLSRLKAPIAPSVIYKILQPLPYEVLLCVFIKAHDKKVKDKIRDFLFTYKSIQIHLNGEELKALGMAPGPQFKRILLQLLYAKLDGKFKTKEEELIYLRHNILAKSCAKNGGKV